MVFQAPDLREDELEVLELLTQQRERLRDRVAEPRRWAGTLRRMAFARAVQGSNSIEGYNASLDDVVAAMDGEPTLDTEAETELALAGYRDAMTYVLQIADDEGLGVDEGLLKSLHFMMLKYDLAKHPGRWRPGQIFVHREETKVRRMTYCPTWSPRCSVTWKAMRSLSSSRPRWPTSISP
jgi:hypothetical protein